MNKKQLKISFYLSQEELQSLRELKGLVSISAYIRSKIFGKEEQSNSKFKDWVDFLSLIPDRDAILKEFLAMVKYEGNDPSKVFFKRLLR